MLRTTNLIQRRQTTSNYNTSIQQIAKRQREQNEALSVLYSQFEAFVNNYDAVYQEYLKAVSILEYNIGFLEELIRRWS